MDSKAGNLVEHLFRTEAGKMTAALTRLFGFERYEMAQDIVQDTIYQALRDWSYNRVPANPTAWLYHVAKNKAIDYLRRENKFHEITSELKPLLQSGYTMQPIVHFYFSDNEIADSQLRMMFATCHPAIPEETQIALVLKTLCGFSVEEIARAFLSNNATIEKRLYRAKEKIREEKIQLQVPAGAQLEKRLHAVLHSLYLLFNEGYNSSSGDAIIRKDLCYEAVRLCILLSEHEQCNIPEIRALLALMCYNASRFDARIDDHGFIILLKDQDRNKWDHELIKKGHYYMESAGESDVVSSYHLEAAISSFHCTASSFEATDWKSILMLYNELIKRNQSPIVQLNRAIALGMAQSKEEAVKEVLQITVLQHHYLYNSTLGDLYTELGNQSKALLYYLEAIKQTNSPQEKELLKKKMEQVGRN
jgi:RNA polymerase sigma factor (sigma-70 family)